MSLTLQTATRNFAWNSFESRRRYVHFYDQLRAHISNLYGIDIRLFRTSKCVRENHKLFERKTIWDMWLCLKKRLQRITQKKCSIFQWFLTCGPRQPYRGSPSSPRPYRTKIRNRGYNHPSTRYYTRGPWLRRSFFQGSVRHKGFFENHWYISLCPLRIVVVVFFFAYSSSRSRKPRESFCVGSARSPRACIEQEKPTEQTNEPTDC